MGTAARSHSEGRDENRGGEQVRSQAGGGGPFRIVKPGQGIHVRWGTAIGAGVLAVAGAHWIWTLMEANVPAGTTGFYIKTLVPVAVLLAALYGIYWVVGRYQAAVDFMIATEGEMKKVNWSSRREVWGATKVVIVTVLALGVLLALVDALFMLFFGSIGVLHNIKVIDLFTGGEG